MPNNTPENCSECREIYQAIMHWREREREAEDNYSRYPYPIQERQYNAAKRELAQWRNKHASHVKDKHQLRIRWVS